MLGELAEVVVARTDFGPGVGDADDGFLEVFGVNPTACSMARAGARLGPSVMAELFSLGSAGMNV